MATVTIKKVTDPDELYCRYPGQSEPQRVTLDLDIRTGELSCSYWPGSDNWTTFAHRHRLILDAPIPALTADAANDLMEEMKPLAQQVLDGAVEEWDGRNNVGVFTEAAEAAWEQIYDRCNEYLTDDSEIVSEWLVEDWFSEGDDSTIRNLDLTAGTTDERIGELADEQVAMAGDQVTGSGYVIIDRKAIVEHLTYLRDQLRSAV